MKKIFKQYLKQVIILIILIATVSILNTMFTKSSIKGDYDTVTVGITAGAEARELKKYLIESFKEELDFKKKIEVEAVGSFGTEFRVKSDSIIADERDFMAVMLKEKYEEASVSGVTTNPEANYRADSIMYTVYFIIIALLGFGAVYFLSMIPINEELSVKNIKKHREQIIEEENRRLIKEKKQNKKSKKKDKNTEKDKKKDKNTKKDKKSEGKAKKEKKAKQKKTKEKK